MSIKRKHLAKAMNQTHSHNRIRRLSKTDKLLILFVCLSLIISILGLCVIYYQLSKPATISISDINNQTGIQFPNSATITDQKYHVVIDPYWDARIVVTAQAGKALVQQLNTQPPAPFTLSSHSMTSLPWWTPQNIIAEILYCPSPDCFAYVIVSEEGSDYVFYIESGIAF